MLRNEQRGLKGNERHSGESKEKNVDREQMEHAIRTKLRVVYSSAKKQSRDLEEQYKINASQLWMLVELQRHAGLRVSDIARTIHVHNSTASNLLDSLEERGYVRRERSSEDQRVVQLFLTPAGGKFLSNVPQPERAVVSDALASVSLDGLIALDRGLDEMVGSLKIKDTGAGMTPIAEI